MDIIFACVQGLRAVCMYTFSFYVPLQMLQNMNKLI